VRAQHCGHAEALCSTLLGERGWGRGESARCPVIIMYIRERKSPEEETKRGTALVSVVGAPFGQKGLEEHERERERLNFSLRDRCEVGGGRGRD